MKNLLKNRKGLSTVVTTLIILVISVLLATVVTYYAMNMVGTRVIEEDGRITQLHIWVNCTSGSCETSEAALVFKNTGGRDILVDKVTVRYQDIPWGSIYYKVSDTSATSELEYTCDLTSLSGYDVASDDLCLLTGQSLFIYIDSPDTIDCLDIGTPVPIGIHTSNAIYYKETNVGSES